MSETTAKGNGLGRREFLKSVAFTGGALVLGIHLPWKEGACMAHAAAGGTDINAWLRIARDGTVTMQVNHSEMGQGIATGLPMILAEDMEADWSKMRYEFAPANPAVYANAVTGGQGTGGSFSTRGMWAALRKIGAASRDMLVEAAAQRWGVPASECAAENGTVVHRASGKRLGYGELAEAAARIAPPKEPKLKSPAEFRLIGKSTRRLDIETKLDGSAVYGIDVKVPGMLIATVHQCPVAAGSLISYDEPAALAVKGVRGVIRLGVECLAVVADTFWQAEQGLKALKPVYADGTLSSGEVSRRLREAAGRDAAVARNDGDTAAALSAAAKTVQAEYEVPYLAHACMEPMNCTAHVTADGCDIWAPTQGQQRAQNIAAKLTGLPKDKVRVHTTLLGGGFGRRSETDYVEHAVLASMAMKRPVKVIWSREEDMRNDFYRPAFLARMDAGLDSGGNLVAWRHLDVGPSIFKPAGRPSALFTTAPDFPRTMAVVKKVEDTGVDTNALSGAMDTPYEVPNTRVEYVMEPLPVPIGVWRSVGSSQNAFFKESFMDEAAHAAGRDPYEFRRALLQKDHRHRGVLDLVAEKAGWGQPLPPGRHRGIALHMSYGSIAAQVVELSMQGKAIHIHRVVCAIDCGIAINPDQIAAQHEGGVVYGLTAAMWGEITVDGGRIVQSNFHDYPMLRLAQMPLIESHVVRNEHPPGGLGEPGTPPIAPALTNAIFAASGVRERSLPLGKQGYTLV